jgi:hypothetical protein
LYSLKEAKKRANAPQSTPQAEREAFFEENTISDDRKQTRETRKPAKLLKVKTSRKSVTNFVTSAFFARFTQSPKKEGHGTATTLPAGNVSKDPLGASLEKSPVLLQCP